MIRGRYNHEFVVEKMFRLDSGRVERESKLWSLPMTMPLTFFDE